jgi:hypothetical protein
MLFVDLRTRSLLLGEARKRMLTRAFGTPRAEQSFLVTVILIGAAATALRDLAPRRLPRPTRAGAAFGATLANAALRGVAGEPSAAMPLTGALIAFGLLSRSLRPAIVGSAHEVRGLSRELRETFGARYAH